MGRVRSACIQFLIRNGHLVQPKEDYRFLWIEDFPLFSESESGDANVLESTHHPFTAPRPEDVPLLLNEPRSVRGQHFDLVLNGWEIGGGSIRVHDADLQETILRDILRKTPQELALFRHLLTALRLGAPPHGGMALGFDRLVALVCDASSLRDVVAFPKAQSGNEPMVESPSYVSEALLNRVYGLHTSYSSRDP